MQRMQTASSFDHLAGAREQRRLNNEVECRMRLSNFECKQEDLLAAVCPKSHKVL